MTLNDLDKIVDSMIRAGASEQEILYESGLIILDEIIPRIEAVLDKPYHINREESDVVFPSMLGRGVEPGVFLAIKYKGKDIDKDDHDLVRGFEQMGYKIIPALEGINEEYGVPIGIFSMNHTYH